MDEILSTKIDELGDVLTSSLEDGKISPGEGVKIALAVVKFAIAIIKALSNK